MSGRGGVLAAGGSVVAAVVASACCWLPLLLVAFGVSAAGVSAGFESVRPWFLGGAAALLGAGFYLIYFRKPACAPDGSCAAMRGKSSRFTRAMLWVATAAVILVGLFPNYVGLVASGEEPLSSDSSASQTLVIGIEGMTCEACALNVKQELLEVRGVEGVSVSYGQGQATVAVDPAAPPSPEALAEAVVRAGFKPAKN